MREILFRGKRVDNGEWVCSGNLVHFNEDSEYYIPVVNSRCVCVHDENDNIVKWEQVMFCKVIPKTVGQYTGLTDKNGTKIFEGDISKVQLQVPYLPSQPKTISAVGVVEFNTEKSSYYVVSTSGEEYALCFIEEIIGNIHDNPELLEVAE